MTARWSDPHRLPGSPAFRDPGYVRAVTSCALAERGLIHTSVELKTRSWAATMTGAFRVEVRKTGRGERDSPATNDLPITMRLAEPPEPFDWLRSA